MSTTHSGSVCPACGKPSACAPAEVYCVECATAGWELDAIEHLRHRLGGVMADRDALAAFLSWQLDDDAPSEAPMTRDRLQALLDQFDKERRRGRRG